MQEEQVRGPHEPAQGVEGGRTCEGSAACPVSLPAPKIPHWRASTRNPSKDADLPRLEPSLDRRGLHEQGVDGEGGRERDAKPLWEAEAPP